MKKLLYPIVLMVIFSLLLTGCNVTDNSGVVPSDQSANIDIMSRETDPGEVILYAGKNLDVGNVNVTNYGENILVEYQLNQDAIDAGWRIKKTNVHVGESLDDFPLVGRWGNPIAEKFDYSQTHDSVTEYTQMVPLGQWTVGQELLVAANAKVENADTSDAAWGSGMPFNDKNWATYFGYTVEGYTLTIQVEGNGTTDPSAGSYDYLSGTQVSITAIESDENYYFSGWSGDATGTDNAITILMDSDKTVTATFTEYCYTLTVNIVGEGSVDKNPYEEDCYSSETDVLLTPNAIAGWTFDGWIGADAGDLVDNEDGTWTISMDTDKEITATFESMEGVVINTNTQVQYATIQQAIYAAAEGHTIMVYPGTYYENITFTGLTKNIIVQSSDPDDPDIVASTIIDASAYGSAVSFNSNNSTLKGFTIQNGYATNYGGGIYILNSSPTISQNVITNNTSTWVGGGIYAQSSSPVIEDNIISDNKAPNSGGYGGGIFMQVNSAGTITGNTIINNVSSYLGGAIALLSSHPEISENTIQYNKTYNYGGGIWLSFSNSLIVNNDIENNECTYYMGSGGGIYINSGSPTIQSNNIKNNIGTWAGGIYIAGGTPTIGGTSAGDTGNFNNICGSGTLINSSSYPYNYFYAVCP